MPSTTEPVNVNDLIDGLMNFNSSMLKRFVSLVESIEADLVSTSSDQLQGETEELLRTMLQVAEKSIETLLSLQQDLQTRIIESYFPAQD